MFTKQSGSFLRRFYFNKTLKVIHKQRFSITKLSPLYSPTVTEHERSSINHNLIYTSGPTSSEADVKIFFAEKNIRLTHQQFTFYNFMS